MRRAHPFKKSWRFASTVAFLLFLFPITAAASQAPLPGESASPETSRSIATPNSLFETVERIITEHQRLLQLQSEQSAQQDLIDQTHLAIGDLTEKLQRTSGATTNGAVSAERAELEKSFTAAQTRLETLTQHMARLNEDIDDAASTQKSLLLALGRRVGLFIIFLLVMWILVRVLRRVPERVVKKDEDRFYIHKIITYSSRLIIILVFLYTILGELGSFSAFLGLTGAGVAIALQDVIVSFVAWFFIIGRRGFAIGDRIEVSGVRGDIVDIGVMRIAVQEVGNWLSNDVPTGRRVFIPNSFVFKNYFFNYTKPRPFINDEIKLLFTFESDWEKAVEVVRNTARSVMTEFLGDKHTTQELLPQDEAFTHWGVGLSPSFPEVFTRIAESGVELRLVYPTRVPERNKIRDAMNRALLRALKSHPEMTIAYPTSRAIPTPPGAKP